MAWRPPHLKLLPKPRDKQRVLAPLPGSNLRGGGGEGLEKDSPMDWKIPTKLLVIFAHPPKKTWKFTSKIYQNQRCLTYISSSRAKIFLHPVYPWGHVDTTTEPLWAFRLRCESPSHNSSAEGRTETSGIPRWLTTMAGTRKALFLAGVMF